MHDDLRDDAHDVDAVVFDQLMLPVRNSKVRL
jgi:hypothetical protein